MVVYLFSSFPAREWLVKRAEKDAADALAARTGGINDKPANG
jgi:hypothetical protein